jgi:hypothetical protein
MFRIPARSAAYKKASMVSNCSEQKRNSRKSSRNQGVNMKLIIFVVMAEIVAFAIGSPVEVADDR